MRKSPPQLGVSPQGECPQRPAHSRAKYWVEYRRKHLEKIQARERLKAKRQYLANPAKWSEKGRRWRIRKRQAERAAWQALICIAPRVVVRIFATHYHTLDARRKARQGAWRLKNKPRLSGVSIASR